ncbi:YajQ family cyclic di-GMP-binding protein [Porticoccus litoralis]|uniref:Nucleotide-binding protein Q8A57_01575 n=1 Tax=Porticoccus litoralis TaxID=434086 RepID=A0AAW8B1I9_9GAMM|nr:YajQ family cyclic di-GMP-binding protein [Porticoccus litoralis]MDP1519657.1 YajQ family cyclic di-GMP-binding protein [Porticoccus litoralis]
MPTFDIVSEVDMVEIRNATENTQRELTTRFDFRGVAASVELKDEIVTLAAESDFQCQQLMDMFSKNLVKRNVDPYVVDVDEEALHIGKTFSLKVRFKQGIDQPMAKKIIKLLKDSKMKVQASIQGDKIRVSGKKRDDLQQAIALVKGAELGQPFQYENFRD